MHHAECFIVKKRPIGENDTLVTAYSDQFGLVTLMARGTRKGGSKLSPHLQLFNRVALSFVQGKRYHILTGCSVIDHFPDIRKNIAKHALVAYVMELVEKLATEEKNDALWSHIESAVARIVLGSFEKIDVDRIMAEESAFFLALHGWTPRIDVCAVCKKTMGQISGFHLKEGGVVCPACAVEGAYIHTLRKDTGEALGNLFRGDLGLTGGNREVIAEIRHILELFLEFMSSERIHSKYFLLHAQESHIA